MESKEELIVTSPEIESIEVIDYIVFDSLDD
jgi:hypothetical protein